MMRQNPPTSKPLIRDYCDTNLWTKTPPAHLRLIEQRMPDIRFIHQDKPWYPIWQALHANRTHVLLTCNQTDEWTAYERALRVENQFLELMAENEKLKQTFAFAMQAAQSMPTALPAPAPVPVSAPALAPASIPAKSGRTLLTPHTDNTVVTIEPERGSEGWIQAKANEVRHEKGTMLEAAVRIGQCLIEVRETVPAKRWTRFVEEDTGLSERTSQQYIQLAETFFPTVSENPKRVSPFPQRTDDLLPALPIRRALLVIQKLPTPEAARAFVAQKHAIKTGKAEELPVEEMSEAQLRAALTAFASASTSTATSANTTTNASKVPSDAKKED